MYTNIKTNRLIIYYVEIFVPCKVYLCIRCDLNNKTKGNYLENEEDTQNPFISL